MELVSTTRTFPFSFSKLWYGLSDSTPEILANIWQIKQDRWGLKQCEFTILSDVCGLLSPRNFATMTTWRNEFSFFRFRGIWFEVHFDCLRLLIGKRTLDLNVWRSIRKKNNFYFWLKALLTAFPSASRCRSSSFCRISRCRWRSQPSKLADLKNFLRLTKRTKWLALNHLLFRSSTTTKKQFLVWKKSTKLRINKYRQNIMKKLLKLLKIVLYEIDTVEPPPGPRQVYPKKRCPLNGGWARVC